MTPELFPYDYGGRSAAALAAVIGKRITALSLEDDVLAFDFEGGASLRVYDEGQTRCESRYMRTDDNLSDAEGAILLGLELKECRVEDGSDGCHEVQFLEIRTDRGSFTMASHNEHNGYYGGFDLAADNDPH